MSVSKKSITMVGIVMCAFLNPYFSAFATEPETKTGENFIQNSFSKVEIKQNKAQKWWKFYIYRWNKENKKWDLTFKGTAVGAFNSKAKMLDFRKRTGLYWVLAKTLPTKIKASLSDNTPILTYTLSNGKEELEYKISILENSPLVHYEVVSKSSDEISAKTTLQLLYPQTNLIIGRKGAGMAKELNGINFIDKYVHVTVLNYLAAYSPNKSETYLVLFPKLTKLMFTPPNKGFHNMIFKGSGAFYSTQIKFDGEMDKENIKKLAEKVYNIYRSKSIEKIK
jgi:hypothetical protein